MIPTLLNANTNQNKPNKQPSNHSTNNQTTNNYQSAKTSTSIQNTSMQTNIQTIPLNIEIFKDKPVNNNIQHNNPTNY